MNIFKLIMKPVLLTIVCVSLVVAACNQSLQHNSRKPYFEFDKAIHYTIDIPEDKIWELYDKQSKTKNDSTLLSVIQDGLFSINDSSFVADLMTIGYVQRKIDMKYSKELNYIFCERNLGESVELACIHYYRDVIVFRKDNKISGIAKICFECIGEEIVGPAGPIYDFEQDGLYDLLQRNKKD